MYHIKRGLRRLISARTTLQEADNMLTRTLERITEEAINEIPSKKVEKLRTQIRLTQERIRKHISVTEDWYDESYY